MSYFYGDEKVNIHTNVSTFNNLLDYLESCRSSFVRKSINQLPPLHRGSMHIYRMAKAIDVEDLSPGKCLFRIDNRACPILCLSGMIIVCFLVIEQAGLYLKGRKEGRKEGGREGGRRKEGKKEGIE